MSSPDVDTAPVGRLTREEITELNNEILSHPVLDVIIKYTSDFIGVLTFSRQFVLVNHKFFSALGFSDADDAMSLRPGEVLGCVHSQDHPEGCGEGPACRFCSAIGIVREAIAQKSSNSGKARIMTVRKGLYHALDVVVTAEPFSTNGLNLIVLFIRDIGAEAHKSLMERIFFHDVLNSATSVKSLLHLLSDPEDEDEDLELYPMLLASMNDVIDQLAYYRQLIEAEEGRMQINREEFDLFAEVEEQKNLQLRNLELNDRGIEILLRGSSVVIESDRLLVRRTVVNMLKNAVEASQRGDTIRVSLDSTDHNVTLLINNPAVMDIGVQHQLFQRSFSTKGANRGIGTYSMKLITESYLHGRIGFVSTESDGTTFTMVLPRNGS